MAEGRGGARKGAGRPKGSLMEDISLNRSVTLKQSEWEKLARISQDGSATREVARIVRAYLKSVL